MTLNLQIPEVADLSPKITVFGVGGAGCNAVNNMIAQNLEGVDFIVANTDAQALQGSSATHRIQLGEKITEGLGAGARPSIGAAAAEESIEKIVDMLAGSHMCFITAGMGGGTGTGAAPIIAQAARELGILTVGVVTKPFQFEGSKRMRQAEEGIDALQKVVDTLIIIPNQNLFRIANEKTTFTEAFSLADDVLYQGVKGVTDLMVRPGLINLDFADIRVIMDEMGKAMMGTGEASGEDRAIKAAEKAIANPLLDEISLNGAKGVLVNITGGSDLTLFEVDEAANCIRNQVDPDANIIVGSTLDTSLDGVMRVSVVATGIDVVEGLSETPVPRRTLKSPLPMGQEGFVQEPVQKREELEPVTVATTMEPVIQASSEEPELFDDLETKTAVENESYSDDGFESLPEPIYQPKPVSEGHDEIGTPPSEESLSGFVSRRVDPVVADIPTEDASWLGSREGRGLNQVREAQKISRPRSVLSSLISRMTGSNEVEVPIKREQPKVSDEAYSSEYDSISREDDKIEIPAFLRRQAN